MFTNRNRSFSKALQQGTAMTLISMMALSGVAVAQDAIVSSSQAGAPVAAAADEDIQEVVVVGARAAQQSANDRKKRAKTAMDSIVADDVGAFPDRNLNEAISRVAGVALGRDEYGEGTGITLRGNSMENIRIEMDGLGVGGGGIDVTRSADLTSLPADLIKSVDVVKGSAADMTEGGLGGSVRIQTRTGLDFAKPYFQLRIGGRHNSLGQQWQPEYNLVASRKFFDNRLGVLLNVSGSQFQKNTNGAENNQFLAGYQGRVDFDNSPEKTFSFNPATVASPDGENRVTFGADTLLANSSFTPRQIVEASAAAQSKAECYAAFPLLTAGSGVNQSTNTARRNQRVYELQTCLGQWNDLEPQLPRNFDHTEYEDRFSADLRFDFRVNDNLTIFAKYNMVDRKVDRYFRERRLGGGLSTAANPGAIYNATSNPLGVWTNTTGGTYQQRGVAPGNTNYFYYDGVGVLNNLPIIGDVLPIDPATVKVDENHFVTEYVMNDQSMFIGQRHEPYSFETSFVQAGGQYKTENLNVEFMAGKSSTDYTRINTYTNRSFNYGSARFYVQPSGMWAYDILTPYDETDPANFVQMIPQPALAEQIGAVDVPYSRPYSVTERPLVSRSNIAVEYDPFLSETQETTAKIDVNYNFEGKIPFFTSLKVGVNYRNPEGSFWSRTGGRTISSARGTYYLMNGNNPVRDANGMPVRNPDYVAPVILPRSFLRSTIRACEPTATSIESCNYGYTPDTLLFERRDTLYTITPEEMRNIIGSTIRQPDSNFFNGFEGAEALVNWQGIDTAAIVALMPNTDLSCVKSCVASDGNVYDQPYRKYSEKITAAYYMVEFEQELPFNLLFNGNVGLRMVETEATGTGDFTLEYVRTTQAFNEADYNNANGIQRYTYSRIVDFTKTTRDWLPSYNLNLWVIPDQLVLRYYKGKNVARPAIGDILPVGTCTIDERRELGVDELGEDNTCGRIGNPALKPFTAWNQNLSVEWYPNRDTMISLARFIQDERIGRRIGITQSMNLLEGQGLVDEVTGESLDNMVFSVPTWGNAPGFKKEGWELTTKTAFTFLPWRLRYTGADFNYSKIESNPIGGASSFIVDPNTGDVMPPQGESKYYANLSLWYDDGKTNARISWQARDELFVNIEGNTSNVRNNYPFPGGTNSRPTPYRPGNPVYESKTLYVDAKISHKLTPSVEAFVEARNITKEFRESTNGGTFNFADGTPYVNGLYYGGRHFMFGLTYKMQ